MSSLPHGQEPWLLNMHKLIRRRSNRWMKTTFNPIPMILIWCYQKCLICTIPVGEIHMMKTLSSLVRRFSTDQSGFLSHKINEKVLSYPRQRHHQRFFHVWPVRDLHSSLLNYEENLLEFCKGHDIPTTRWRRNFNNTPVQKVNFKSKPGRDQIHRLVGTG